MSNFISLYHAKMILSYTEYLELLELQTKGLLNNQEYKRLNDLCDYVEEKLRNEQHSRHKST